MAQEWEMQELCENIAIQVGNIPHISTSMVLG